MIGCPVYLACRWPRRHCGYGKTRCDEATRRLVGEASWGGENAWYNIESVRAHASTRQDSRSPEPKAEDYRRLASLVISDSGSTSTKNNVHRVLLPTEKKRGSGAHYHAHLPGTADGYIILLQPISVLSIQIQQGTTPQAPRSHQPS